MQFNLPLHNNLEVRRRQKINPKRIIIMNNPKLKLHHLLPKRNHSGNQNSHVLFVVTITTLETVHIAMKWKNFQREFPTLRVNTTFSSATIYGFSNPLHRGQFQPPS
jgi:hypothetical protein